MFEPMACDSNVADVHTSDSSGDGRRGPRWMFWRRRRDVLCALGFVAHLTHTLLRSSLSLAIVAMTSASQAPRNTTIPHMAPAGLLDWDSSTVGIVLSAFHWGYVASQLPGGWLALRLGGKAVLGAGHGMAALLALVIPAATVHPYLLVAVRVVQGLCEGLSVSSSELLMGRWVPVTERNLFAAILGMGIFVGEMLSMAMTGYLAASHGWPSVFYISGTVAALWLPLWYILVKDDPQEDPRISPEELRTVLSSRAFSSTQEVMTVPWLRLLTSVPVWAVMAAVFAAKWSHTIIAIQMPAYIAGTVGVDVRRAGLLSAIPHLVAALGLPVVGCCLDLVTRTRLLATVKVRKMVVCASLAMTAALLTSLGYVTSLAAVMTCLSLAELLEANTNIAAYLNYLDLAPRYSSVLVGMTHTVGSLAGVMTPLLAGHVVRNKMPGEWRMLFHVSSGVGAAGVVIYGLLASAEQQSWASTPHQAAL